MNSLAAINSTFTYLNGNKELAGNRNSPYYWYYQFLVGSVNQYVFQSVNSLCQKYWSAEKCD